MLACTGLPLLCHDCLLAMHGDSCCQPHLSDCKVGTADSTRCGIASQHPPPSHRHIAQADDTTSPLQLGTLQQTSPSVVGSLDWSAASSASLNLPGQLPCQAAAAVPALLCPCFPATPHHPVSSSALGVTNNSCMCSCCP